MNASTSQKSSDFLTSKGEQLRDGAMTKGEFFVFEEIKRFLKESGKHLTSDTVLNIYNYVQSICCTLDATPLLLRSKSIKQIQTALRSHDHDTTTMAALFRKQVELRFKN